MGSLTAESRGQVRAVLDQLQSRFPIPLRRRIEDEIRRRCEGPFSAGRRIKEADLDRIAATIANKDYPLAFGKGDAKKAVSLYAELFDMELSGDGGDYTDRGLIFRAFRSSISRRRLVVLDWHLGVVFSGHMLGRLFERGEIEKSIIDTAFQNTLDALPYIVALLSYGDTTEVVIPFGDGLALGRRVVLDPANEPVAAFRADESGCGNPSAKIAHFAATGLSGTSALLISTFINADMMSDGQRLLRDRMIADLSRPDVGELLIERGLLIDQVGEAMDISINDRIRSLVAEIGAMPEWPK